MLVRLYSPIGRVTGYGRAGVELAQTLLRVPGVDLEISASANPGEATQPVAPDVARWIRPERDLSANPDVIIVHTPPLDCAQLLARIDWVPVLREVRAAKVVAYTTWETPAAPPEVCQSLQIFDHVWVPSGATVDAFLYSGSELADKLRVVPHAFDEARAARVRVNEPHTTIQRPYRFYYVGAWTQRKNPAGVIRAFVHAFKKDDPVELVMQLGPSPVDEIAQAVGSTGIGHDHLPKLDIRVKHISDAEMAAIHDACDCFVTASRGEAWNLGAFDAMLAGNHVIAPAHQGSDDFLRETSARLYGSYPAVATVDARVVKSEGNRFSIDVRTPQGVDGRSVWNEPDLIALATYMRAAARDRVRRFVGPDPRGRFGYEAVSKIAALCLEELKHP